MTPPQHIYNIIYFHFYLYIIIYIQYNILFYLFNPTPPSQNKKLTPIFFFSQYPFTPPPSTLYFSLFFFFCAGMLVDNAVVIAKHFGMSDLVIGLTIIAVGTSLPELAASLAGALKGEDDMAVGNIIGSNVFNILAVMGLPGLLNPSLLSPEAMSRDFWVMLGVSLLLVGVALGKKRQITRLEGALLLCSFIGYITYLLMNI
ncbi:hypothetical protein [Vibrio cholerae]|uniref:hypothetical protein n=1 Tax=Vibrio cholerae TaxID=666 RepID=UPI00387DC2F3